MTPTNSKISFLFQRRKSQGDVEKYITLRITLQLMNSKNSILAHSKSCFSSNLEHFNISIKLLLIFSIRFLKKYIIMFLDYVPRFKVCLVKTSRCNNVGFFAYALRNYLAWSGNGLIGFSTITFNFATIHLQLEHRRCVPIGLHFHSMRTLSCLSWVFSSRPCNSLAMQFAGFLRIGKIHTS